MNGDVKSYRMNSPMNWKEFKTMPDDIQAAYITALRGKFNPPDSHVAKMMGVSAWTLSQKLAGLGLRLGARKQNVEWDKEGWKAWAGTEVDESKTDKITDEGAENLVGSDEAADMTIETAWKGYERAVAAQLRGKAPNERSALPDNDKIAKATPVTGRMTFECPANLALEAVRKILENKNVRISVEWDVL